MKFELGAIVGTPGALAAMEEVGANPASFLLRHANGDWGELCEGDKRENEFSVEHGLRILSSYNLKSGRKIWLITEADHLATTFLLPSKY